MIDSGAKRTNFIMPIILYFIFQIPYLTKVPTIMVDEPWYSNTAYNFINGEGFINTVPGSEGGDLLFLFPFIVGIFFKVFGTSLITGKIVSIIGGFISLFGFLSILKELQIKNKIILSVSSLIFIFSNVNYVVFRTVRPESWVVCFGIWSIYFLLRCFKSNRLYYYSICGLLSGLSFLTHPHGLFFIFLIGILIMKRSFNKNDFKIIISFLSGLFLALVPLFYVIYFIRGEDIFQFFKIFFDSSSSGNPEIIIINNLLNFFNDYTLGAKRIFILFIEIGVIIFGLYFYNKDKRIFIFSFMGLLYFSLFIISPAYGSRHFGQVLIFSFILIPIILDHYKSNIRVFRVLNFLLVIYLINNIAGDSYLIWRNYNNTSYSTLSEKIDKIIPNETNVLTLLNFWFPLKDNNNFNDYTRWRFTNYENLDLFLESGEVDYAVISDYLTEGKTSTSNRNIAVVKRNNNKIFYDKIHSYAKQNGKLLEKINTNGYSDIEIWKLNKK
ncbi:MAG: hypothetical protein CMG69_03850 [Candidatus Marinimicrobia bacterium]|nr:hypothetical protein [Candidatus Neomarinimicrobiota bacterium]|tara:strand:+ start:65057 stop:66547 length:1491 start_codon:yes stop_codon:yes gene_type:complete